MTISAIDNDENAHIKYRIYDEDELNFISNDETPSSFFAIDAITGVLKTRKSLHARQKPFKFIVEASDGENVSKARVVINLISDANRMALVFADLSPKEVRRYARALEELLHDRSPNLVIEIEKFR